MNNLNIYPSKVLTLPDGTIVELGSDLMRLVCGSEGRVFFETVDSRPAEYNRLVRLAEASGYSSSEYPKYEKYIKHVRDAQGAAMMSRQKMYELLESKNFTIG